jgi:hypothetical protein
MIRKKRETAFSLATSAKRLRGGHAQTRDEIMIRFNPIGS